MNNQANNVLDDGRVGLLLLKLSIPAFFGMFVMTLYNVVDTIFIGHYVGPLGIAGLSIVFPLQMLSMGIGQMMGMGGASLISRLIGANEITRTQRALGNAITSVILLSVILTIAGLTNADSLLRFMGASDTILPYAKDYMVIILGGIVFPTFAMALNNLIRAEGNARVAMIGMIIGATLNIAFDAVFIIALGMGIKGAALATVMAQAISVLYFLRYYSRKSFLKIHAKNLILELRTLKAILSIGIASFARTVSTSLSVIFINITLITYGGDFAISAFGILHRLIMFAMLPAITFGQGLQPILGFNYGAKRYDRALRVIKIAIAAATISCTAVFAILYFAPGPFIRIFTSDNVLIAMTSHAAKRVFLTLPLIGFIMVSSLIFQSIGKVVQSFVTAISRPILFLIPLIFVLPHFWQLDGVWLAFPITDALTFTLSLFLLIPQLKEIR